MFKINEEKISGLYYGVMITSFVLGSAIVLAVGGGAKQDAWVAIIIGLLEGIVIVLPYLLLMTHYSGMSLVSINDLVWGKYLGKVFSLAFVWYTWCLGSVVSVNRHDFLQTVLLHGIPDSALYFPYIITFIFPVLYGIEVMGRFSLVDTTLLILSVLFITALSIPYIDPNNLRPVLATPLPILLKESHRVATFPFGEVVAFVPFIPHLIKPQKTVRYTITGMVFGALIMLILVTRNIGVLGNATFMFTYPSFTVARVINMVGIFNRMETFVALNLILATSFKMVICVASASFVTAEMLEVNVRAIVIPFAILATFFTFHNFPSVPHNFVYAQKIYPIYALPFQFILPFLTWIAAIVLKKKSPMATSLSS